MFRKLLKWFYSSRQPKAYAVKDDGSWVKMVSYSKPYHDFGWQVRGPFRSEIDCEGSATDRTLQGTVNLSCTNGVMFNLEVRCGMSNAMLFVRRSR